MLNARSSPNHRAITTQLLKGGFLKKWLNQGRSFDQSSRSSLTKLTSPFKDSPISNPVDRAKWTGDANMVKSPMVVSLGVLDKDEVTNDIEIKGGSITSSRLIKDI